MVCILSVGCMARQSWLLGSRFHPQDLVKLHLLFSVWSNFTGLYSSKWPFKLWWVFGSIDTLIRGTVCNFSSHIMVDTAVIMISYLMEFIETGQVWLHQLQNCNHTHACIPMTSNIEPATFIHLIQWWHYKAKWAVSSIQLEGMYFLDYSSLIFIAH